jgi:RNA polymerase sigma-70 factor, ECF subfamily
VDGDLDSSAARLFEGLFTRIHLSRPSEFADVGGGREVEAAFGASDVVLCLANHEQTLLVPVPTRRSTPPSDQQIEGTFAGRAFATSPRESLCACAAGTRRELVVAMNRSGRPARSSPDVDRAVPDGTGEREPFRLLRAGDEEAFGALVERHYPAVVRLARSYVPGPAVAEEVAQEAWLALRRGLDRFEGRSSLRTWLFRIVVNRAISIRVPAGAPARRGLRAGGEQRTVQPGRWWVAAPTHWTDEALGRLTAPGLAARVREVIEDLPPAQRAVVRLRDVDGVSVAKRAPFLGSPKGTSGCCSTAQRGAVAGVPGPNLGFDPTEQVGVHPARRTRPDAVVRKARAKELLPHGPRNELCRVHADEIRTNEAYRVRQMPGVNV